MRIPDYSEANVVVSPMKSWATKVSAERSSEDSALEIMGEGSRPGSRSCSRPSSRNEGSRPRSRGPTVRRGGDGTKGDHEEEWASIVAPAFQELSDAGGGTPTPRRPMHSAPTPATRSPPSRRRSKRFTGEVTSVSVAPNAPGGHRTSSRPRPSTTSHAGLDGGGGDSRRPSAAATTFLTGVDLDLAHVVAAVGVGLNSPRTTPSPFPGSDWSRTSSPAPGLYARVGTPSTPRRPLRAPKRRASIVAEAAMEPMRQATRFSFLPTSERSEFFSEAVEREVAFGARHARVVIRKGWTGEFGVMTTSEREQESRL